MTIHEAVRYGDPDYYLQKRGTGGNNLIEVLEGKDEKHGGRVHTLLQRLVSRGNIVNEGGRITLPPNAGKIPWLDIGAGAAPIARLVRQSYPDVFNIVSLDISPVGVLLVPKEERPPFALGDVFSFPIARESVGVLTAHDIIEHLQDPLSALEECYEVLRPGGVLQIVVPEPSSETYLTDPTHILPPIVATVYFRKVLAAIGFKGVEVVTRGFGKETGDYFKDQGEELFKPEGGNHIYAFAWKPSKPIASR